MCESWLTEELSTAQLDDQRLNERFAGILHAFAERPNASVPAALGGRAELEASYRFFDNEKVTPQKLLKPHYDATRKRCAAQPVREPNPLQGENAIEWISLTTLPISTVEEVRRVIQYYTVRWMIEIYFRSLKSGCRIEERRFETLDRMSACTAVYMIVAWRTLFVCRLGRSCPDLNCEAVFDASEWQSVWTVTRRGEPLPSTPPKLCEMIRRIAGLGGYVIRPNRKDPPGVETVWKGLQRMRDLAWAWDAFGPRRKKQVTTCVGQRDLRWR